MNDTNVTFIAKVTAKSGSEGQLHEALANLIAPTRKEAGCLAYFAHASLENPREVVLYESWQSEAHFLEHTKSAHFTELMGRMPALCDGPPTRELLRRLG
jgi:quinol monooxygenase YgiN